jgi:hypothetical protein
MKAMKRILLLAMCIAATFAAGAQTPAYNELSKTAYNALAEQDYSVAYKAFRAMDSLYVINDFEALYFYYALLHDFMPSRETEKALLFRLARNKCCDMRYLDDWTKRQQADTLDYWNDIVAIVAPRGYQDTVYQNRLLAMNRANNAARQMRNGSNNQDSVRNAIRMVDSANLSELKQLIVERGFPTYSKVGYYCVKYASAIVLNQPLEFFQWYLKQAKAAADSSDYDPEWLGYLIERDRLESIYDTVFYSRIEALFQADQEARHLLKSDMDQASAWRIIHEVDSANLIALEQLIAERGFPTLSKLGYKCCDHAALIAQHSPPDYLHWFLEQAQVAADSGDFIRSWIAYMTDRDLDHQNKPQLYGTQGLTRDGLTGMYLIKDIEHLNERRRNMDLEPIEDYLPHMDMPDFYFHPSLVDYRQYSLNLHIEGDTLRVSGFYLIPYETYTGQPIKVDTAYCLPLADYRTADGAIVLRREGNWYPHKNGELLTAQVHIKADDYYIIGGTEWEPSFDIHLVLLPKDKYACKVMESPTRPFRFYRLASDTTQRPEAYYREFIDSYTFYCTFFGDTLTDKPMNIVEIGDPQFIMCQSLRDMIIFGHYFYDVYTMIPDFSWIPHEVAHQWWGNGIFFKYRDYALGESLNEYIKLQFLKSRGRGYEEQIAYYKTMMERAEKTLPIANIRSVESQDESIAIYHAAPYRLEQMKTDVDAALQQLYRKHKHTIVSRDTFLRECTALSYWLMPE